MSFRRKLAIATWSAPREGNIYGRITLDVTDSLRYMEQLRQETGEKITITHLVGKAAGQALAQSPSLNGRIVMDRFVPFRTTDVAFLVALEDGNNLGKVKVARVDERSVVEIARDLRTRAEVLHRGEDEAFQKSMAPLRWMPTWLVRKVVWFVGWLGSGLGLRIRALGVEPFPFGSCIVTSVGMLGFDEGYAPPTPFARVPVLVLVGAVGPRPSVVDGQIVVRHKVTVTATIDHRVVDGYQLGAVAKVFREVMESPWLLDGRQPPALLASTEKPAASHAASAAPTPP
ncbi:MAG: 2-oxo acid dehydrogenase subunit E2 [Polyangiaceae bacterium]|jgi:pyruvate dehydrogenase E2 component (dihydrolipoamide acetyltransferase)|nr:2-oxo acid dehydrogenase subunit E2 [Polyangiaceae bacterium]